MRIKTRELKPILWKDLERLFGENGACAGCWCMFWRLEPGDKFSNIKGPKAKARFKKLVTSGAAHGVLAYNEENKPIGWLAFDKKEDYSKLNRSPSLKTDDAESVWSLPCFFVKSEYRGKGVATAMLATAEKLLEKKKAKVLESYPYRVSKKSPGAFIWTGTVSLFEQFNFKNLTNSKHGKQRMRKHL